MRILHLADRLTERGGAYRHLLGILHHLAREHQVHLAVGRDDDTAKAPCPTKVLPGLDARTREPVDLEPLLRETRPEVIHLHNVVNPAVLEWAGDHQAVITVQDHRTFCPGQGKWTTTGQLCNEPMSARLCAGCFSDETYFRHIYLLTEERLQALQKLRIVVLSCYMKEELVASGVSTRQITVIPPFVHGLDPSAALDGSPCVLFVGRLVESKGVRDAVSAWQRSRLSLPLVLAGGGPLRGEVRVPGCEWVGWVPHEKMSALYQRAAAVIMPSRWKEPFGMVGLEALTMRTPVAAWNSGGVSEWHPGPGLVEWGDVDGLGAELRDAIGRPVDPPQGFEADDLMSRLWDVYHSHPFG